MSSDDRFDIDGILTAWDIIKNEGINRLPVVPSKLIRNNGYGLLTYQQYADISGVHLFDIVQQHGVDGFTQCVDGKYIIAYNQNRNPTRIRWTLMHELSHIYLQHSGFQRTIIRRSPDNYDYMEREADELAARILCPSIVVHHCGVESAEELQHVADLSKQAAEIRWRHLCMLRSKNKFLSRPEEVEILDQFKPFIEQYKELKQDNWDLDLMPPRSFRI